MPEKLSDEEFEYIYSKVPRLCVDLILKNEKGILFTKRAIEPFKGKWHLPGGGVRLGETLEETAKRISKKELGIDIDIIKNVGHIEYQNEEGKGKYSFSIVFLVRNKSEEINLNEEADEFIFAEKLPENIIPEVRDFLENLGKNS